MAFHDPTQVIPILRSFPAELGGSETEWLTQVDRLERLMFGGLFRYSAPVFCKGADDANIAAARALVDWVKVLRGFSDDVLERAWLEVVSRPKAKPWQALGEIVAACRERSAGTRPATDQDRKVEERRERERMVDNILRGPLGPQIFDNGLATWVKDWIEIGGRDFDLERIESWRTKVERDRLDNLANAKPGSIAEDWLRDRIPEAGRVREQHLRARYLGEAA